MERAEFDSKLEMPPSIVPVLILSGSDYEMGYQYGQQAAPYFEMRLNETWVGILKQFSYEEVLRELEGIERSIKQSAPEAIDMMEGIVQGATASGFKLSYLDVLLLNSMTVIARKRPVPEEEILGVGGCSGFAAWGTCTKDGRLICGASSDSEMNPCVAMVVLPDKGNSYITVTNYVGALMHHPVMNTRGLVYVHHGGGGGGGPAPQSGLPASIAVVHTSRFANNANEGRDMQLSYTTRSGGLWVDIQGNNCVIERNESKTVRQAGDFGETDFIYAANNALCRELGQEGRMYTEHSGWYQPGRWGRNSVSRNLSMWNMLHNYRGEVDVDFVKMMWRFPGDPPPYPRDARTYLATNGEGWNTPICHLLNKYVAIMLPDDGDKGKMYVCAGPAGRVAYPADPTGYSFFVAPTHTFYELTLASSPGAVVSAAKMEASAYLAEASERLMWLNYTDTGYAALNELFSQASSEFWQGSIAYDKGSLTGGNEMLLYFSKAATAFTRSQAHAKQVLEALVPPPTCPSELKGLEARPWFGDWGEWATREPTKVSVSAPEANKM